MKGLAALGVAVALVSPPGAAADWDHDANIDSGVAQAVAAFRKDGSSGMERSVTDCYGAIDPSAEFDERLRRFEYCVGMDFAGFRLDRRDGEAGARAFFTAEQVLTRVGRVTQFIEDPNVGNQVVRAWSRASVEALGRNGYPELTD